MISEAKIISQPYSGEYTERIYDHASAWNYQSWTFVKFVNEDCSEWCGNFRGSPRRVAISTVHDVVLVLTSNYLFQLDRKTGDLIDLEDHPTYHHLTVSPGGDFILADYYNFEKMTTDIKHKELIESPIEMDAIKFNAWDKTKLEFTCDEFTNWDRHLVMTYDSLTNKIEIVKG